MGAHQILKYEVKDGVLRLLITVEIISLEKEILDFVKKVVLSTKHQVSHYIYTFFSTITIDYVWGHPLKTIFDTPLPHVGIPIMIYLNSTF